MGGTEYPTPPSYHPMNMEDKVLTVHSFPVDYISYAWVSEYCSFACDAVQRNYAIENNRDKTFTYPGSR